MINLEIMTDYNHHTGFVDKVDRMANSYSISCQAWKWGKIYFFISSIWPFWTATSFFHLVGRKFNIEIFDSPFWETCWLWLDKNNG